MPWWFGPITDSRPTAGTVECPSCHKEVSGGKTPWFDLWGPTSGQWVHGRPGQAAPSPVADRAAETHPSCPRDGAEVWLTAENCPVCLFWWVLHSFLVKYCAWKTRIYGQHSSYKQSDCTWCKNYLAMTGEVAMVTLTPPPRHVRSACCLRGTGQSSTQLTCGCPGTAVPAGALQERGVIYVRA